MSFCVVLFLVIFLDFNSFIYPSLSYLLLNPIQFLGTFLLSIKFDDQYTVHVGSATDLCLSVIQDSQHSACFRSSFTECSKYRRYAFVLMFWWFIHSVEPFPDPLIFIQCACTVVRTVQTVRIKQLDMLNVTCAELIIGSIPTWMHLADTTVEIPDWEPQYVIWYYKQRLLNLYESIC
jgi:hypothetical protein